MKSLLGLVLSSPETYLNIQNMDTILDVCHISTHHKRENNAKILELIALYIEGGSLQKQIKEVFTGES
jgi:hypothetical protein